MAVRQEGYSAMTPLIQEMVALSPEDAIEFQWFDATAVYKDESQITPELLSYPMPFPMTAIVYQQHDGLKVLLLTKTFKEITGVVGWIIGKSGSSKIPAFTYCIDQTGVRVTHQDGSPFDYRKDVATNCIGAICNFLLSLQLQQVQSFNPVRRSNHAKRIRQGKVPMYDWKTITIEPPKLKSESRGGTHASPRWHERRGHFRVTKKGLRVWVNNCVVGQASKGAVFHDYSFKEMA